MTFSTLLSRGGGSSGDARPSLLLPLCCILMVFSKAMLVDAFVTNKGPISSYYGQTRLLSTIDDDSTSWGGPTHVKKAGGGVPATIRSGDTQGFWDPVEEGKLGMSGDQSLNRRLSAGSDFTMMMEDNEYDSVAATFESNLPDMVPTMLHASQCWLEHLDAGDEVLVPPPFAKASKPVQATVLGRTRIIGDDAPGDIQHVVLKLPEGMHYVEGQSLSVIPPGLDPRNNKRHKPRLYSIASTRYGDLLDGSTVSLCVRRAVYVDPATGREDPTKQGVCSSFLCDVRPGQIVDVAGPVGKTMVLPKEHDRDIIMVATGTGIAPFRGFLHRLFMERTVVRHMYTGTAWLILGVPTTSSLLYKPEFDAMMYQNEQLKGKDGNNNLKIDYAVSREMTNDAGGKLYVQDVLRQNSEELFTRLEKGAVIYFCGLKGMMPGILEALEEVASQRGIDWTATLKKYKDNHQWHVEVY